MGEKRSQKSVISDDLLEAMRKLRGNNKTSGSKDSASEDIFPVSSEIESNAEDGLDIAADHEAESNSKSHDDVPPVDLQIEDNGRLLDKDIGFYVKNKGIYMGTWVPRNDDGNYLGRVFNVFAAPEDLKDWNSARLMTSFNYAVGHISSLPSYLGHEHFNHDVKDVEADEAIYKAIRDSKYDGEWFIPTKSILADNLYKNRERLHKDNELLVDRFKLWKEAKYLSCTPYYKDNEKISGVNFSSGGIAFSAKKDEGKMIARLVRVEPRP
jgi:hypothetical protein